MTTYRIYETGNDTGKWFYAKQSFLWGWTTPSLPELRNDLLGLTSSSLKDAYCRRFNTKEQLISAIKEAHEKKSRHEKSINSIYHKVIDEITIPD